MIRNSSFFLMLFLGIVLILESCNKVAQTNKDDFSMRVKISLREVGNQLLLSNNDSISLILPVTKTNDYKYQLAFKSNLTFNPDTLVAIVKKVFTRASLSKNYIVEVLQCANNEVAYSFEMNEKQEKTIIPCSGRILPKNCYKIMVTFFDFPLNESEGYASYFYFLIVLLFALFLVKIYSRKKIKKNEILTSNNIKIIGRFEFYPEQNKLVKKPLEINLSKKECELLQIFISRPNQIIKREELTKKVWEDHGVFVGRSLDTYISKLRKKLQDDDTIQLINVHGVGYKLEIN